MTVDRVQGGTSWRAGDVAKRVLDVVAALAVLVLLSPLMAVVAVLVRRSSPGGAIFAQTRVGRFERPFTCYKFRTMAVGVPNAGTHEAQASWITPVGRKLRAYKLDELPQLVNVLRGDMSLVGPRPCLPNQSEVIEARRARGVFDIRPGITGIAQLAAVDMSTPERLAELDRKYLDTRSLLGDLRILAATALGRGSGDVARY